MKLTRLDSLELAYFAQAEVLPTSDNGHAYTVCVLCSSLEALPGCSRMNCAHEMGSCPQDGEVHKQFAARLGLVVPNQVRQGFETPD